ncbi:biotin/lipoyl-binding protein [Aestuariicella hydrocarbonica]|uniref:Biotin/lipoyl-binding protein n=1 Tax=Pseudomaricurvus hydrocarbonicus TaxID=1470433 RepID=A0A9E5MP69_9GAMM|nr:biotin/lipoyl-binding protein [Aestuariicella hydrocarbonica]NHO67799.1 biotin/lipoyl-binding protein [Aestuariicella hydrocarbonica]
MKSSHFSQNWYRVANLKLCLRNHVDIHRQIMRGKTWYVIQDAQSGKYFRVSPSSRAMIVRLDGRQTVDQIWQEEGKKLGKLQPSQGEMIELIAQLYRADLIRGDVPPYIEEMVYRAGKESRQRLLMRYKNPLALRFPLIDPDRFLDKVMPLFRPLFNPWGMLLGFGIIAAAIVLAAMHWGALTSNLSDRVFSQNNLILLVLLYPLIKGIHELGHAITAKAFGGEVHEIGLMLLVFMPVPYVDASCSAAFKNHWQRAAVGAAGILVECLLAALALFVWLEAEPGLLRAAAFNVMMIGGVSTLLFNGNPLLRFDGYYVLSDILNIPNLAGRSSKYLIYLIQKKMFSLPDLENPAHSAGEARWFVFYGIASFCYRLVIMMTIALFIASKFFFIGVILACLSLYMSLLLPLLKGLRYVLQSPSLGSHRPRVQLISASVLLVLLGVLFVLPAPYDTKTEGIVSLGSHSRVVSGTSGFVSEILYDTGSTIKAGDVLVVLEDRELAFSIRLLEAELQEYKASYRAVNLYDRVQADILKQQIARTEARLSFIRQRQSRLSIRAGADGHFVLLSSPDLQGRYISEGTVVGYVMPSAIMDVNVLVQGNRASLVSDDTVAVEVRLEGAIDKVIGASIIRQAPSALVSLPSSVLAAEGGGLIAVNPNSGSRLEPLDNYYQFELALSQSVTDVLVDNRVYVRFVHSAMPLGLQWFRLARQTFLSMLNV